MPAKLLADVFYALEAAKSPAELRCAVEKFVRQLGFERFVYALTIRAPSLKPQEYILSGYPAEWVERYLARGYFKVDPVVRHAQSSTLPLVWNEDDDPQPPETREFWDEAKAFGLRAGLSLSVHEQLGVTGIFSVSRDQALDLQEQDLAALIGRAQMFASVLHRAVSRIDLPGLLPDGNTLLTSRERECLRWAADGKTAWEIGQILGIAERTAVFHVNNIVQKLGAANKTQAIVRALALKLV